jgi:hypothetical protein
LRDALVQRLGKPQPHRPPESPRSDEP